MITATNRITNPAPFPKVSSKPVTSAARVPSALPDGGVEKENAELSQLRKSVKELEVKLLAMQESFARLSKDQEASHAIIGTVCVPTIMCREEDDDLAERIRKGETIAYEDVQVGARFLLYYPMMRQEDTSYVFMRCKVVDRVTGQISFAWMRVFGTDDEGSNVRYVSEFVSEAGDDDEEEEYDEEYDEDDEDDED